LFKDVSAQVQLERKKDIKGLDDILRDDPATAIVSLSFDSRKSHSVCVSFDGSSFVLYDPNVGTINRNVSVAKVLDDYVSDGTEGKMTPGEVIVFRPKKIIT